MKLVCLILSVNFSWLIFQFYKVGGEKILTSWIRWLCRISAFFFLCYQIFGLFSLIFSIYLPSLLIKMVFCLVFYFLNSNGTWILHRWDQINIFCGWWRSYTCKYSQIHFEPRVWPLIQLFLSEYFEMLTWHGQAKEFAVLGLLIFSNHFITDFY